MASRVNEHILNPCWTCCATAITGSSLVVPSFKESAQTQSYTELQLHYTITNENLCVSVSSASLSLTLPLELLGGEM